MKKMSQNPADYPNFGLSHSLKELEDVRLQVWTLPIEEQAKYADGVCRANVNNIDFHERQLNDVRSVTPNYPMWNTTSVGNVAFLALNAPTESYRQKYQEMLEGYIEWNRNQKTCIIF